MNIFEMTYNYIIIRIYNYNFWLIYSRATVTIENKLLNRWKNSNEIINQFILFYKSTLYD
jgi:hypothetical protein